MKPGHVNSSVSLSLLLAWVILSLALFSVYPASESFIQRSTFKSWEFLPEKLSRVHLLSFIIDLSTGIAGVLIFCTVSTMAGLLVIHALKIRGEDQNSPPLNNIANLVTAFSIGQITFSSTFLVIMEANGLTPLILIVVLIITVLVSYHPALGFFKRAVYAKSILATSSSSVGITTLRWLSISLLFFSLLYSSTRLSYDAVNMYFSNEKIMALSRQFHFFRSDLFLVSSLHTGINYSAIIQLFGDQAARLYSWANGLAIIGISLAVGQKTSLSKRGQLFLAILFLTSTAFLDLMGDGKIDLTSTVPMITAIYWMIDNSDERSPAKYLLIGLLAGFAMISRPFNFLLGGLFIGAFYFLQSYRHRENKFANLKVLSKALLYITPAIIVMVIFHAAMNWAIAKNPLATVHDIFQGTPIWHYTFDPKYINLVRIFYPLSITYMNNAQSLGNISPVIIALLPTLLLKNIRERLKLPGPQKDLLIAATIPLAIWIWLSSAVVEIRYVFFLWFIIFVPVADLADKALQILEGSFRFIFITILIIFVGFMNLRTLYISIDSYSPITEDGIPQCYDINFCRFLKTVNDQVPLGERGLGLNAYHYYMRPDLILCASKGPEIIILKEAAELESNEFWKEVYRQGYKYLIYENNFAERHLLIKMIPSPQNAPPWLQVETLYSDNASLIYVYKIQATDPPVKAEKTCLQNANGIWEVHPIP